MKKSKNKVKETMKTMANCIINEMSKKVDIVEYIWAEVKFNSVDYSNIEIDCGGSDRFYWNEKTNSEHNPRRSNEKSHLFVRFSVDVHEDLFVDMRTGEGYYAKDGMNPALRLGDLDDEGFKILLPIYKKLYLDSYEKFFADDFWLEAANKTGDKDIKFLGIRDWFSVKANELGVLPWECQGVVREVK